MINKPKQNDIIIDFESMLAARAKKQSSKSFDFFGKNYTVGVNGEIFSNELCDLTFPDCYLDPPGHLN